MSKPMHLCNHPGCREVIPYDQRYCKKHDYRKPTSYADKEQRHLMNKATYHRRMTSKHEGKYQRFYHSTAWKKLSHHWLMMHPLCVNCMARGIYRKGDLVDHIVELRDDWTKRLDPDNLETMCISCHNKKSAIERRKRHGQNIHINS